MICAAVAGIDVARQQPHPAHYTLIGVERGGSEPGVKGE